VILLGFLIGKDRRRNQFLDESDNQNLDQVSFNVAQQEKEKLADLNTYDNDVQPSVVLTGRDRVLAKITRDILVEHKHADVELVLSPSKSEEILTISNTASSARDLVMEQIASRRQHDKREHAVNSQIEPITIQESLNKAEICLAYAEVSLAIQLLQPIVLKNSDNIAAKLMLAEAYCLNQQQQDFIILAQELLQCLQIDSIEWQKLQGFAHRIAPLHPDFSSDPEFTLSNSGSNIQVDIQAVTIKRNSQAENNLEDDASLEDDLEMEDCATQLDLAKAYIAMGDNQQAQQALNNVINLGDENQRQQAHQLLVQLANS
jgi:FimV-like protein